ncbi:MAG: DEAD/DEAH box helicase [Nitrososphaerales archaeon]
MPHIILKQAYKDDEIFELMRPYVREWFKKNFNSFTLPQSYALPEIRKGKNILIAAPTGSGKTLAAFLSIINELFMKEFNIENYEIIKLLKGYKLEGKIKNLIL